MLNDFIICVTLNAIGKCELVDEIDCCKWIFIAIGGL